MTAAGTEERPELLQGQNRVLELMAGGAPLRRVLDTLLRIIQAEYPGMLCSVLLLDADGLHVRHGAAPDLPSTYTSRIDGEPIGPKAGSCGTAAFRREVVIVEDIETDPLWDDYREIALAHGLRACWSAPIFDGQGRVLGTFAMYFRSPRRPTARHLHLIGLSTHIASIAISKARGEEEVRRREAQLVEAQHIARLGSYEWNLRTNEVHRSAELCRIFGLRPDEFEPSYEGYLARVHPEDRDATRAVIDKAYTDRLPFDFEERIVRPDGAVRMLHSQGRWTFDDAGQPVKLIGICQDITEQKKADLQLRAANTALSEELKERTRAEKEIQALSARLISAQEEERTRLARELHDDLSQEIAALAIAATNLKKELGPGESHALAMSERIQQKLVHLNENVRRLSHNLHPAVLEYFGLASALESYCAEFSELTGLNVSFRAEGSFDRLPTAAALCFYRVAQEALQNVLRHAGVREAQVSLSMIADSARLAVSDHGAGMDLPNASLSSGLGFLSMKERARLVGGRFSVESQPGQGTRLTVTVPLPE